MSLILKSIFEGIEAKEKGAAKLYKDLAVKTSNSEIKEALLQMSKEELGHDEYFDSKSLENIKVIDDSEFEEISKKLNEKVIFDMDNVLEVIDKAIAEETFAEKAYLTIGKNLSEEINSQLMEFAKQEALHRHTLIKLKDEFKESDWG